MKGHGWAWASRQPTVNSRGAWTRTLLVWLWVMSAMALGCGHAKPHTREPLAVRVQKAEAVRAAPVGARYSGTVKPYRQVDLSFKDGGYVTTLLQVPHTAGPGSDVQVGDEVKSGAVLASVDEKDFRARVEQALAQVESAQASVMQAEGRVSEASAGLGEAHAGLRQAMDAETQAEAQVRDAQAALRQAHGVLAEATASRVQADRGYERARRLMSTDSITLPDFDAARAGSQVSLGKEQEARAGIRSLQAKIEQARAASSAARGRTEQVRSQIRGQQALVVQAEGALEATRASLRAARAQLVQAQLALSDCHLRAPFDSVVMIRSVERGALVGSGAPAFTVGDARWVKVAFAVPDLDVDKLQAGQSVAVRFEAVSGKRFVGRISSVSPAADPKSRVFEVEVSLSNPQGRLRSGMIATLDLTGAVLPKEVLTVPLSALVRPRGGEGYALFVIDRKAEAPVVRLREVAVGQTFGNKIEVTSGIAPGDEIVVKGAQLAVDGEPVDIAP